MASNFINHHVCILMFWSAIFRFQLVLQFCLKFLRQRSVENIILAVLAILGKILPLKEFPYTYQILTHFFISLVFLQKPLQNDHKNYFSQETLTLIFAENGLLQAVYSLYFVSSYCARYSISIHSKLNLYFWYFDYFLRQILECQNYTVACKKDKTDKKYLQSAYYGYETFNPVLKIKS